MVLFRDENRDPIARKRQELEEQMRTLEKQRLALLENLNRPVAPPPEVEEKPPVWREEDSHVETIRRSEATAQFRRPLARQRNRDRMFFFILAAVLLMVLGLVYLIYLNSTKKKTRPLAWVTHCLSSISS